MALKSLLFVFAFVLLVSTTMVTSTEEDAIETERRHHHHHRHHRHHHEKPPMKVQTYPQPKAPAYPPKPAHSDAAECDRLCAKYCDEEKRQKRECQRDCGHCCREYDCVPGLYNKCTTWDKVWYHERSIECPKHKY